MLYSIDILISVTQTYIHVGTPHMFTLRVHHMDFIYHDAMSTRWLRYLGD